MSSDTTLLTPTIDMVVTPPEIVTITVAENAPTASTVIVPPAVDMTVTPPDIVTVIVSPIGTAGPKGDAGDAGPKGDTGDVGPAGADGQGVPVGGATGQVLAKVSATDFDTTWIDAQSKWLDGNDPNDAVYTDGNVGIGTGSPLEKLGVEGNLSVRNKIRINSDNTAAGGPRQNTGFYIYCSAETVGPFGNPNKNGLYIAPVTNTTPRLYLGDPNNNIYSLNLSFVTTVENMPPFRGKDGLVIGGQASHCITRTTPNKTLIRASGNNSSIQFDTGPSFNDRIQRMLLDVEGNLKIGSGTPDTRLHVDGAITQNPLSADPPDPAAGNSVQWVSDGTGSGDAGDVMMKINVGGTVKTVTLIDFSEVA